MTTYVDGNRIAESMKEELQNMITEASFSINFHLIYVGSDPVIDNFVRYKKSFGKDIGVDVVLHRFSADIDQETLQDEIRSIQEAAHAMIVQLPLPDHLDTQVILDTVDIDKDVDVLGSAAKDRFARGEHLFMPPVTGAIVEVFHAHNIDLDNKEITVIGEGSLVGKPMMTWLDHMDYPYHLVTKETDPLEKEQLLAHADIIISGAGAPYLVKPEMLKDGVILIDAGTSEAGKKILGDIHPDSYEKASLVTPVPGGIGPITIAILYRNILRAYQTLL